MSTYAIGDLQGCLTPLQALLAKIAWDPRTDRLWFVGDLVNRGPQSLETLRFVRDLGDRAVTVLGNHDLHLLGVAAGHVHRHAQDTLDGILAAPDRSLLLDWLRRQPLIHVQDGWAMVHAGLLPQWSIVQAQALADEVHAALRGQAADGFFRGMYGNQPDRWDPRLTGMDRLRVITNAFTRLRWCTDAGVMEFAHKGELEKSPAGFRPGFEIPGRASAGHPVVFGHWSALGLRLEADFACLDSGCLWGRSLTALRLEDRAVFQVPCSGWAS